MRLLRLLIAAPFLLLLVLFALSNTAAVRLTLWPTDLSLEWPLSAAILAAAALAFLLGGLLVWINELGQRRRARRAEHTVRLLEDQVRELRSRVPASALLPPG
jgi:putative membrane protein